MVEALRSIPWILDFHPLSRKEVGIEIVVLFFDTRVLPTVGMSCLEHTTVDGTEESKHRRKNHWNEEVDLSFAVSSSYVSLHTQILRVQDVFRFSGDPRFVQHLADGKIVITARDQISFYSQI